MSLHPRRARSRILTAAASLAVLSALLLAQTPARQPARITGTDPELRLTWYDQMVQIKSDSKFKDLKWQFLGPTNISGRVTDVAVVTAQGTRPIPSTPGRPPAASGRPTTRARPGRRFSTRGRQPPSGTCPSIPPIRKTLYVGTGEANIFRSSQSGTGVYKTADGGKTWTHLGLAATQTIARIVVHPSDGRVVYVAASGREWTKNPDRGVYKTVDGGKTWDKILFVDDETGAIDLRMDPRDPEILYAATWQRTRKKWNDPRNDADHRRQRHLEDERRRQDLDARSTRACPRPASAAGSASISAAASPTSSTLSWTTMRRPASRTRTSGPTPTACPRPGSSRAPRSTARTTPGTTWRQVSGLTPEQKSFMERHSNTYGWVFGQIRVDPNDENTVYTMGLPAVRLDDGGKTFRILSGPGVRPPRPVDRSGQFSPTWSRDSTRASPCPTTRAATWRYFQSQIPVGQFFNVGYDMATPFKVYGSMQDHGSFRAAVDLSRGRDRIPAAGI